MTNSKALRAAVTIVLSLTTIAMIGCSPDPGDSIPDVLAHIRSAATSTFSPTLKGRWVDTDGFAFSDVENNIDIDVSGLGLAADVEDGVVDTSSNESVIRYDGLVVIGDDWNDEGSGRNYVTGVVAVAYQTVGPAYVTLDFGPLDEDDGKGALVATIIQCIGRDGQTYVECYVTDAQGSPLESSPWLTLVSETATGLTITK